MEIWAKVYAVAEDEDLLKQVHQALKAKTFQDYFFPEMLEPCAVLPRPGPGTPSRRGPNLQAVRKNGWAASGNAPGS